MKTKPNRGKGDTAGNSCITEVVINDKPTRLLLDPGAFCSCVGKSFLKTCVPDFEDHLLPIYGIKFNIASNPMKELGIFETNIIFPHINGNLRITVEFVVMENCPSTHFILGNDYLIIGAFASDKEPLGSIIGHEIDINLNIERPYPPLLRGPTYPAGPKSREALEIHSKELLDLGVIRKVGHNEEVEMTTPVIVELHNGKSRMVGDCGALNTYTVPEQYPIPKIQVALTQIYQAVYISTMDSLKGFSQNLMTLRARKYLRNIVHC
ncbi:hypothetical protein O181_094627 [Austropuccinia psidii MF-1]|uniref:Peptidase A2 domain-containing protein n=1 Tax=Austropuccinia psidii MF-1 TaxID=1389203 RepID=A0A9Q3J3T1_9BASI|nr:hypothetical protein [Austropuccinia psidii MF-1]